MKTKEKKKVEWILGTRTKSTDNPTDEPQRNIRFFGKTVKATMFGIANGMLMIHAEQFYYNPGSQEPIVEQGNAPFFIEIKLNGNPYRVDGPHPACIDPLNLEEFNIVIADRPRGHYEFTVYDSTPPPDGPMDARSGSGWAIVSPPFGRLRGLITPPNPETMMTVWFEFGLTNAYGRIAEAGFINGEGTFPVEIQLSARVDEGSPEEFLEPGKTYHYRIATSDTSQTWYGDDVVFETEGLPVAITLPAIVEN